MILTTPAAAPIAHRSRGGHFLLTPESYFMFQGIGLWGSARCCNLHILVVESAAFYTHYRVMSQYFMFLECELFVSFACSRACAAWRLCGNTEGRGGTAVRVPSTAVLDRVFGRIRLERTDLGERNARTGTGTRGHGGLDHRRCTPPLQKSNNHLQIVIGSPICSPPKVCQIPVKKKKGPSGP